MKVVVSTDEFNRAWEKAHKRLYVAEPNDELPTAFKDEEEADDWAEVFYDFTMNVFEALGIEILDEFQSAILEKIKNAGWG